MKIKKQIIVEHLLREKKMNKINNNEMGVIWMLSSFMGDKDICWPSQKELAEICGTSVRTIKRIIKSLENKQIIFVEKFNNNNNRYRFNPKYFALFNKLNMNFKYDSENEKCQVVQEKCQDATSVVPSCHPNNYKNNIKNNKSVPVDNLIQSQSTSFVKGGRENGEMPEWMMDNIIKH